MPGDADETGRRREFRLGNPEDRDDRILAALGRFEQVLSGLEIRFAKVEFQQERFDSLHDDLGKVKESVRSSEEKVIGKIDSERTERQKQFTEHDRSLTSIRTQVLFISGLVPVLVTILLRLIKV